MSAEEILRPRRSHLGPDRTAALNAILAGRVRPGQRGACAFLRPGVEHDELFFILGWSLTDLSNAILKEVLNHTRNIQSKDFERLPYPVWVSPRWKRCAVVAVQELLARARKGEEFSVKSPEVRSLNALYAWPESNEVPVQKKTPAQRAFHF